MPFVLATYNVKDLLGGGDERERAFLERKLDWAAERVRACQADVVGLQEMGSLDVARSLVARLLPEGYGEPIVGTPDARGIRCAFIARIPVAFARIETQDALPFPVFQAGDPPPFGTRIPLRRAIVHAGVEARGLGLVHVLVAHFKSPRPLGLRDANGIELPATTAHERAEDFLRSTVWRAAEALHTRGLVDEVLAKQPGAHLVVTGDLNDGPQSAALRVLRADGDEELFDCTSRIEPSARFSILHDGRRLQVDHALATRALAGRMTSARFLNDQLRDHGITPAGRDVVPTVDSDHAPLVVSFD